ncbi:MAG: hypothetical protein Q8P26_00375 [Candidatus Levybacteria bacterium]|nr:hypothetical protein [Candidatus Levybacteria bacterium]MDZ4228304.1 hypothetical protein [Candidatus Levybacteria bacterium]
MDISIIGKNSIRIKGKQVAFVADPSKDMPKTSADAVILLSGLDNVDTNRITDSRIIINGPGGYEVGGVKISGTTTPKGTLYKLSIDDLTVIIGKPAETKADGFSSSQIVVVNADDEVNISIITALEPKMVIIYGEKKEEVAKALGIENAALAAKVTTAKDKLPEKMEVVVLASS